MLYPMPSQQHYHPPISSNMPNHRPLLPQMTQFAPHTLHYSPTRPPNHHRLPRISTSRSEHQNNTLIIEHVKPCQLNYNFITSILKSTNIPPKYILSHTFYKKTISITLPISCTSFLLSQLINRWLSVIYLSSLTNQSILLGDFNIPLSSSSLYSKRFLHAIDSNNCSQYVNSPTHTSGNILDLIIALNTPNIILNTSVISLVTDHLIITFNLQFPRSKRLTKTIQFRKTKNITITDFTNDLMSHLLTFADYPDINSLDSSLLKTLNRLVPTLTKIITPRLNTKWFNRNLSLTKYQLRYTEKKWRKHKSEENLTSFKQLSSKYRQLIKKAKREYYTDTITAAGNNAKKLYQISNSLLGRTTPRILPDCPASTNSANFDNYFNNKIINIINSLPSPTLPSLLTPSYSLHSFKPPP